jgi:hypothetical protein
MEKLNENNINQNLLVVSENIKLCNKLQGFINILVSNLNSRDKFISAILKLIDLHYEDYMFMNKIFIDTKSEFNKFYENINFLFSKTILSVDVQESIQEIEDIKVILNNILKKEYSNLSELFVKLDSISKVQTIQDTFLVLKNSLVFKLENISNDIFIYQSSLIDKFTELAKNTLHSDCDDFFSSDLLELEDSKEYVKQNMISIENSVVLLIKKVASYKILLSTFKSYIDDFFDDYKRVLSNKYYVDTIEKLIDDGKSILFKIDKYEYLKDYIPMIKAKLDKLKEILQKEYDLKNSEIATIKNFEFAIDAVLNSENFILIEELDNKILQLESLSRDVLTLDLKYSSSDDIIEKINSKIKLINDFKHKKRVMNSSIVKNKKDKKSIKSVLKTNFYKFVDMF